jgi:hypothetical protein
MNPFKYVTSFLGNGKTIEAAHQLYALLKKSRAMRGPRTGVDFPMPTEKTDPSEYESMIADMLAADKCTDLHKDVILVGGAEHAMLCFKCDFEGISAVGVDSLKTTLDRSRLIGKELILKIKDL